MTFNNIEEAHEKEAVSELKIKKRLTTLLFVSNLTLEMGLFTRSKDEPTPSSSSLAQEDATASRKKTIFDFLNPNRYKLNEASLQVFRSLPPAIRQDPSMINFQLQASKWNGTLH